LSTPKILICPSDSRSAASTFGGTLPANSANVTPFTNDLEVSYAVGVDAADINPQMILTGDNNMGANANPPTTAFQAFQSGNQTPFIYMGTNWTANLGPGWLDSIHSKNGNCGLADGSVQTLSRSGLQSQFKNSGDANQTPNGTGPGSQTFTACPNQSPDGRYLNRMQFP